VATASRRMNLVCMAAMAHRRRSDQRTPILDLAPDVHGLHAWATPGLPRGAGQRRRKKHRRLDGVASNDEFGPRSEVDPVCYFMQLETGLEEPGRVDGRHFSDGDLRVEYIEAPPLVFFMSFLLTLPLPGRFLILILLMSVSLLAIGHSVPVVRTLCFFLSATRMRDQFVRGRSAGSAGALHLDHHAIGQQRLHDPPDKATRMPLGPRVHPAHP